MDTAALLAGAGALAPILVAAITRAGWSATAKRWVALAVSATLTGLVWALTRYPESVSAILGEMGGVIAAAQITYAALKPTGLIDLIESATDR
jgi:hypothetical protein|nr:MAG TPA: hypothetical protein [Caudoviricetes sp.]